MPDLTTQLENAANSPQMVTTDGLTVQALDPDKIISLDRYLKANSASGNAGCGLSFRKLIPPGPVSGQDNGGQGLGGSF